MLPTSKRLEALTRSLIGVGYFRDQGRNRRGAAPQTPESSRSAPFFRVANEMTAPTG